MKRILITFALAIVAITSCRTQIDPTFIQIPWQNPTETHILLYTQSEGYYHHFPFNPDSLVNEGYTIYEVDSVFTSDRTADLDGNYFRFTNGVFAVEGGGNSTYTEPSGGYFVFNPDSGAIRAGARIFGDAGLPLGSINFGEDNEPGQYGVHIGADNRSTESPPFGRLPSQILIGFGNESGNVPFSFALGESNNIEFFAGGGDEFLPSGAIGWGNLVRGNNGIAIGWNNDINNYSSFAFGGSLRAYNDGEIALGVLNTEYPHPPPQARLRPAGR